MGKRVQAQAFLDGVIDHGAHFCTYLLGTDMEMNTPEGFALMNWETGYGDWIAEPVWDTMRVLPWLEKTAIVLSDTFTDEHHEDEIAVSPRTILKRQVARAAAMGLPSRPAPSSSTTSSRRRGRSRRRRAGARRSDSATTTRTTTSSRRRRPSRSIGSSGTR